MGSGKDSFHGLVKIDKLMKNELLKDLKPSVLDFDDLDLNTIQLEKEEVLYRKGDTANSIFLIIEGEIKLLKKESNGKLQPLISTNGYFGHEEYFLKSNRTSSAVATKNSLLVELTKANIELILAHDNTFLNTIIDSVLDLDPVTKDDFKHTDEGLSGNSKKLLDQFPMEISLNKQGSNGSSQNNVKKLNLDIPSNNNIKRVESGINNIIKNINQNLILLQEEKDKLKDTVSGHEIENQKLIDEISRLREQEAKFINLESEKNNILLSQRNRIIELEKETLKVRELESDYSRKIELLAEREEKISKRTQKIENELLEKDTVILQLDKEHKESKNVISDLNEIVSVLTKKADEHDVLIRRQKATLVESAKKIESLSSSLSEKEMILTELRKDLTEKAQLISSQKDKLNSLNNNKVEFNKALEEKDEKIQNLNDSIKELQIQLENQKETEKNKNDFILNQSNKVSEYEEQINSYKNEILHKDETIESFIKDIGELSETVWQKQHEINDQNIVVAELHDEINNLKNHGKEFISRESNFNKEIDRLKSQLDSANNELSSLKNNLSEKIEIKEKENNELTFQLSEATEKLKEEINELHLQLNTANEELSTLRKDIDESKNLVGIKEKENENLSLKLAEATINLKEEITKLQLQLKSANDELISLRQNVNENKNLVETKEKENENLSSQLSEVTASLEEAKEKLELQNIKVSELENNINSLKTELSDTSEVERLKEELDNYKDELLNSQLVVEEKEKAIEEQEISNRSLRESKAAIIKTLTSTKEKFEEDLNKKEIHIKRLKQEIEIIKKSLEEKTYSEEQQNVIIDNQAQKIADLEIKVNESEVITEKQQEQKQETMQEEVVSENDSDLLSEEQIKTITDDGFLSKCTLITSESANTFFDDRGLEHLRFEDINIVNINLSRATLDMASVFNKFLMGIISKERKKIVVNLTACNYIDSSILGALVSGVKKARTFNGDLRIVYLSQSEYSMFTLTKMDNIFKIFKDLEEAVISYQSDSGSKG